MPAYSHTTSDRTELRKEEQVTSREERLRALLDEAAQDFPTALKPELTEFVVTDTYSTALGKYSLKVGTIIDKSITAHITIFVDVGEDDNAEVYALMSLSCETLADKDDVFGDILTDFIHIDDNIKRLICNYDVVAGEW